jgi:PAS domain S-box-containing protein
MRNNQPITNHEYELREGIAIISRTDASGIITDCNEDFIEASGYSRNELIGQPHNLIRHPDMPAEGFRDLWDTLKRGRPWSGLVKNRRKNGDYYWVYATATPLPDGSGYTSVRTKPKRADVQETEALYQKMRNDASIRLDEGRLVSGSAGFFSKLTITQRLWLISGLPLLLGAVLTVTGLLSLKSSSNAMESVYKEDLIALNQLADINDLNQMSLIDLLFAVKGATAKTNIDDHLNEIKKDKESIDKTWSEYMASNLSEEEKSLAADHLVKRDAMWVVILRAKDLLAAGKLEQANSVLDIELNKVRWVQEDSIDKLSHYQTQAAEQAYKAAQAQYHQNLFLSVLLGVVGLLVVVTIVLFSIGYIRRSLSEVGVAAGEIAKGNLTHRIPWARHDEIGDLVSQMAIMRNALHELIASLLYNATALNRSAGELSSSAVAGAHSSESQSSAASSMAAAVEQMSVSMAHVGENALEAHTITQDSSTRSDEGGRIIHEAADEMSRIADAVRLTASTISELEEHSTQISSIANVIKEIADQTNLLALNAAIEAARAGEAGRGFAVVADEVRKLAERTANSTKEINVMIAKIQDGTRRAVQEMDTGVARVNDGVQLAHQAADSVSGIREGAKQATRAVDEISNSLKEQVAAAREIAQRVEQIAQGAEENSTTASQTSDAARQLESLAQHLYKISARFKI